MRSWEGSSEFAQVKSTFASVALPSGIGKIVALACSTMSFSGWEAVIPASMAQHALALMLRDFLVSSGHAANAPGDGDAEIKCYAQDPIYTPVDEKVLSEAVFTVLDDPRAFLEIDEASVVISCAPNIPVRQIVADIARPAIMIWDKVRVEDTSIIW